MPIIDIPTKWGERFGQLPFAFVPHLASNAQLPAPVSYRNRLVAGAAAGAEVFVKPWAV